MLSKDRRTGGSSATSILSHACTFFAGLLIGLLAGVSIPPRSPAARPEAAGKPDIGSAAVQPEFGTPLQRAVQKKRMEQSIKKSFEEVE